MLTNSKIHNKSNLEVSGRGWDLDGKKLIKPVLGGGNRRKKGEEGGEDKEERRHAGRKHTLQD